MSETVTLTIPRPSTRWLAAGIALGLAAATIIGPSFGPRSALAGPLTLSAPGLATSQRIERQLPLTDVARRARISRSYLYELEGREAADRPAPTAGVLYRLAQVLGIRSRTSSSLSRDGLLISATKTFLPAWRRLARSLG